MNLYQLVETKKILTSPWHLKESSAVALASCLGLTGNDQTEPT